MSIRRSQARPLIRLADAVAEEVVLAAKDTNPVSGFTHNFYRYPARFSPSLVRATINAFTEPGDLVFDPFVGGGTTLVEALASGRNGVGTDISALASFVTAAKTTIYSAAELQSLQGWADKLESVIDLRLEEISHVSYKEAGYLRHLDGVQTWRLRKAITQALTYVESLQSERKEQFARCAVLRTAQWALDGRKVMPSLVSFRARLREYVCEMVEGAAALTKAASAHKDTSARCLQRSISGIEHEPVFKNGRRPRLVITSPPYPGIHVLYHRWQIHGGKETPAPFWIANRLDGDGAAYYTMGDRKTHALGKYFLQLRAALDSVAAVCDHDTTVVQVVAFSEPNWQLPRYLSVADDAGFEEYFLARSSKATRARRLWRNVPNRKWYASQKGHTSGSLEVVLFHRLRR